MTQQTIKNNLTTEKIAEKVANYNYEKNEIVKKEKQKEQKKINKQFTYDVKRQKGKVVIIPHDFPEDFIIRALNYYEQAIKNYLAKCKEN